MNTQVKCKSSCTSIISDQICPTYTNPTSTLAKNVARFLGKTNQAPSHHKEVPSTKPEINPPMPWWKRTTDIAGALLGLIFLSPVIVVTGIYIKLVSKGPVIFKQERVGLRGRRFKMWKLRTYEVTASEREHKQYVKSLITASQGSDSHQRTAMKKLDVHPGIIPGGNLIRKTCIDELLQLVNVLLGDMSLVGPRPAIPYEVEEYSPWHEKRLNAMPGMSGLWQVSGKNRLTFNEMVNLDIQYEQKKSFILDAKILLKTPSAILSQLADSIAEKRAMATRSKALTVVSAAFVDQSSNP